MKKLRFGFAGFCAVALLFSITALQVTAQDASFAGVWEMAMTGGGQGGGGGHRGGGGGPQSLTITQEGDKFRVSHKTSRGENAYDATVSGNTISWTEEHEGHQGNTMKIEYKATLNGDTLKGTMGSGQFSHDFTAKRSK